MMLQFVTLLGSFILAWSMTALIRRMALARGVVDVPDGARKLHSSPTPLLGGLAVFLAFTLALLVLAFATSRLIGKDVSYLAIWGIVAGGSLLMFGGYLDDRYGRRPWQQFMWPLLAALVTLMVGIRVAVVTNPFGGLLELGASVGAVVTFLWLLGMMYTTKLLDGLDGLATGVGAIGGIIIFCLTQFTPFYQPPVGLMALVLAGSALGFLVWNWHPAKVFLGEGGSLYLGYVLGVLAIISGAKIATALLVMGVPILDVAWVILRRVLWERRSLASADRKHLHYRLLDAGFTHRQAVAVLYVITASFGITSLFLRTDGKLKALGVLVLVVALLGALLVWRYRKLQKTTLD